jgi:hypothetical protein
MTRTRVLAAAAVAALAVPGAAQAAGVRATVRAETATKTVLDGAQPYGAARAYLDTDGTPHALAPNTVLGQLVTATSAVGADVGIGFDAQFGGFVGSIGGAAAPASGFWQLFVDNVSSTTGAETTTIRKGQEVVWVLDPDFNTPGPTFLDVDLLSQRGRRYTFRVTLAGGAKPVPAKGATLSLNGEKVKVPASGRVAARIEKGTDWTARAALAGSIRSETLSGSA